ncbi:type III pantothenate kinase [Methylobacillus gramineus]|uniref:type III pantothenate kinase n=1 Tax=Methylobacillus gramineus TaxID=755169 RepID=UPI001CFF8D82|nr:type III pantothenate kinase [Methylobacillus gramineus]MCB5183596.1 type III pantothenate kinase [Methylobacillus gramineus]
MDKLLAIDAGNTRIKWAVFTRQGDIAQRGSLAHGHAQLTPDCWQACSRAVVANVAGESRREALMQRLVPLGIPLNWITASAQACGLTNGYEDSTQLGIDRWAAMVAAWQHYKKSCVVVNAGTALTVDLLERTGPEQGRFVGGIIVPGLRLMQSSLGLATANIADQAGDLQDFPVNTADAVYSGILNAMCGAVDNMLQRLSEHCGQVVPCIVSGGDAETLLPLLQRHALAREHVLEENLVLQGLWHLERDAL